MIMSRWGIPILSLTMDGMYSTFSPETLLKVNRVLAVPVSWLRI
jgi:hypothetical protein